jgi:hypothetical protein
MDIETCLRLCRLSLPILNNLIISTLAKVGNPLRPQSTTLKIRCVLCVSVFVAQGLPTLGRC